MTGDRRVDMDRGKCMRLFAYMLMVACVWGTGCGGPNSGRDNEGVPNLKQVRSRLPKRGLVGDPNQPIVIAYVTRLDLELDQSLDELWSLVKVAGLDEQEVAGWSLNGLRVGYVPGDDLEALGQAIPGVYSSRTLRVPITEDWRVLCRAPVDHHLVTIDYVTPTDGSEVQQELGQGNFRLLATGKVKEDADVWCTFMPQHFRRMPSIVPRTPQEQILEGRLFDQLKVQVPAGEDGRLLIAWLPVIKEVEQEIQEPPSEELPADKQVDEQEVGEEPPDEEPSTNELIPDTDPSEPPASAPVVEPQIVYADNIGKRLLTAQRLGHRLQRVILIRFAAVNSPATDQPLEDTPID